MRTALWADKPKHAMLRILFIFWTSYVYTARYYLRTSISSSISLRTVLHFDFRSGTAVRFRSPFGIRKVWAIAIFVPTLAWKPISITLWTQCACISLSSIRSITWRTEDKRHICLQFDEVSRSPFLYIGTRSPIHQSVGVWAVLPLAFRNSVGQIDVSFDAVFRFSQEN